MKKTVLIIAALGMTFSGVAQNKYIVSANVALNQKDYDEAKTNIDKAIASPETKDNPKALYAKVQTYLKLQEIEKYKAGNPYREAVQTMYKLVEIKPDHERKDMDQFLFTGFIRYYNDGIKLNNERKFIEAADLMKNVVKIHDLEGGKRLEKHEKAKLIDTLSAQANLIIANASYYNAKYDESIPLLITVKNNPITKKPTVYEMLIDAYTKQKNSSEALAVINEGRKTFPDDVTIRNAELNYYIQAGKQDELLKKLEEAVVKEPQNADLQFYLAVTYFGMANPKDGKKPANAADLIAKSEAAYMNVLKQSPDVAAYNYNFGALYYSQASDFNDQMNAVTGSTPADKKKYEDLTAKRDEMFVKSTPYFEKSYSLLGAKESELKGEDMKTYKQTLLALKEIYTRQNKMDKAADMKKKYETLK